MSIGQTMRSGRPRLSVAERREQFLNHAVRLLLAEGLSAMSMEGLARSARVSKGLIYHYFDSQAAVLNAVLAREFTVLRHQGVLRALSAGSPSDGLVAGADAYLRTIASRSPLVHQLLSDVAVVRLLDGHNRSFCRTVLRSLIRPIRAELDLPPHMLRVCADMLMAIPEQAGRLIFERRLHVDMGVELCAIHVRAVLAGLAEEFGRPASA